MVVWLDDDLSMERQIIFAIFFFLKRKELKLALHFSEILSLSDGMLIFSFINLKYFY